MTKHCRDCRNPIGPARTWCFECRERKIDVLLNMRLNAMSVPSQEHWIVVIDRWLVAVTGNNGPMPDQKFPGLVDANV